MRLSIEITPEQHKKLKAIAALQGKSIKDYVLEKSLPTNNNKASNQYDLFDEEETLRQLETLFESRNDNGHSHRTPTQSLEDMVYDMIRR